MITHPVGDSAVGDLHARPGRGGGIQCGVFVQQGDGGGVQEVTVLSACGGCGADELAVCDHSSLGRVELKRRENLDRDFSCGIIITEHMFHS
jgi:hypothetical protein